MTAPMVSLNNSKEEILARFITDDGWIRKDQTVKPDAFVPPRDLQLSVTRHLGLSKEQLHSVGRSVVAEIRDKKPSAILIGRADITIGDALPHRLSVEAHPVPGNENHAHIVGWPGEKSAQKAISLALAAASRFEAYL